MPEAELNWRKKHGCSDCRDFARPMVVAGGVSRLRSGRRQELPQHRCCPQNHCLTVRTGLTNEGGHAGAPNRELELTRCAGRRDLCARPTSAMIHSDAVRLAAQLNSSSLGRRLDLHAPHPGMPFSELELARLTKILPAWSEDVPHRVRDQLPHGFRIGANDVVIFGSRPHFQPPHNWFDQGVAKIRFVRAAKAWRLYCRFRDLRWRAYEPLPSANTFDALFAEVRRDPSEILWG